MRQALALRSRASAEQANEESQLTGLALPRSHQERHSRPQNLPFRAHGLYTTKTAACHLTATAKAGSGVLKALLPPSVVIV